MRRFLAVTLVLAGCQTPSAVNPTPVCRLALPPRPPVDTVRIVLPEPVDPARNAMGTSEAEGFLFAHLYEPLVRRDCAGVVVPGLSDRWSMASDSTWRFHLRGDGRFSDGSPATANAVATALSSAAPAGWRVTTQGGDVVVGAPGEALPGVLSERRYVIAKAGGPGGWALSTAGTVTPRPNGVMLAHARGAMVFTWTPGADARDLLERGADAALTDQRAALDFAGVRPTFDARPLPWSRTYVLVVAAGQSTTIAQGGRSWRDAVRGDARVSAGPYWWATAKCANGAAPAPTATAPTRVVYAQGDSVARDLAERLVARGVPRADPLAPADLLQATVEGADYAILRLPRATADACATLAAAGLAGRSPASLISLVDTRLQLIVRSGRFGVTLDGNGTPRIEQ